MSVRVSVLVTLVVLVAPRPALADMPPPPDSPDAHCSLEEQCPNGVFCEYAFNPGDRERSKQVGAECRREVEKKGLESRCRKGNMYTGKQLFCPKGETGTWTPGQTGSATPEPATPEPATPEEVKSEPAPPEEVKSEPAPSEASKKASSCTLGGDGEAAGLLGLWGALWLARRRRSRG
ncbi:MAG TPA: hypothetical protein VIK91_23820 [Nannocystis sp.]